MNIGVIDYGVGNHTSIVNTLMYLGFSTIISKEIKQLKECDILILPGVGSFHIAAKNLRKYGIHKFLISWANQGKPILGICLGMQLFASISNENGCSKGLSLIPGEVKKIKLNRSHIGWNNINIIINNNILKKYEKKYFYFCHKYFFKTEKKYIITSTKFKNIEIPSIVGRSNILGFQFHPEKSQKNGIEFIKEVLINF